MCMMLIILSACGKEEKVEEIKPEDSKVEEVKTEETTPDAAIEKKEVIYKDDPNSYGLYNVLIERYEKYYGEAEAMKADADYADCYNLGGLCYLELKDLNNDNVDELIMVGMPKQSNSDFWRKRESRYMSIWTIIDGELIYVVSCDLNSYDTPGYRFGIEFANVDGTEVMVYGCENDIIDKEIYSFNNEAGLELETSFYNEYVFDLGESLYKINDEVVEEVEFSEKYSGFQNNNDIICLLGIEGLEEVDKIIQNTNKVKDELSEYKVPEVNKNSKELSEADMIAMLDSSIIDQYITGGEIPNILTVSASYEGSFSSPTALEKLVLYDIEPDYLVDSIEEGLVICAVYDLVNNEIVDQYPIAVGKYKSDLLPGISGKDLLFINNEFESSGGISNIYVNEMNGDETFEVDVFLSFCGVHSIYFKEEFNREYRYELDGDKLEVLSCYYEDEEQKFKHYQYLEWDMVNREFCTQRIDWENDKIGVTKDDIDFLTFEQISIYDDLCKYKDIGMVYEDEYAKLSDRVVNLIPSEDGGEYIYEGIKYADYYRKMMSIMTEKAYVENNFKYYGSVGASEVDGNLRGIQTTTEYYEASYPQLDTFKLVSKDDNRIEFNLYRYFTESNYDMEYYFEELLSNDLISRYQIYRVVMVKENDSWRVDEYELPFYMW